jgi:hypothetical protein
VRWSDRILLGMCLLLLVLWVAAPPSPPFRDVQIQSMHAIFMLVALWGVLRILQLLMWGMGPRPKPPSHPARVIVGNLIREWKKWRSYSYSKRALKSHNHERDDSARKP